MKITLDEADLCEAIAPLLARRGERGAFCITFGCTVYREDGQECVSKVDSFHATVTPTSQCTECP